MSVSSPGYKTWSRRVSLTSGKTLRLEPKLVAVPARPGKLFINSRPWSHAYVDGRKVGTTPIVNLSVSPGRHTIKLVARDGREKRRSVRIRAGRTAKVFVPF